jgi:hypothetical protein
MTAWITEHFLSPAVPASWATSASAGQDASESLNSSNLFLNISEVGGRLETIAALNQDRTAIYHNGLPGAESFLHQKQIGLRYVMSLADSANRETLSHAFV